MSWLGALNDSVSSFSSITGQIGGQISNFTKEVLTETSEENIGKLLQVITIIFRHIVTRMVDDVLLQVLIELFSC